MHQQSYHFTPLNEDALADKIAAQIIQQIHTPPADDSPIDDKQTFQIDLTRWKVTLPITREGSEKAKEVKFLHTLSTDAFQQMAPWFVRNPNGSLRFYCDVHAATTKNSSYGRSELRERVADGSKDIAWALQDTSRTLRATLQIDEMPIYHDSQPGEIIIGQIHGADDELCRLYYVDDGSLYFAHEYDDGEDKIPLLDANGHPANITKGQPFSYEIDANKKRVKCTVLYDGKTFTGQRTIHPDWNGHDGFYFKAGLYMGVKPANGTGAADVTFYDLTITEAA